MRENKLKIKIDKPSSSVMAFYINSTNTPLWIDSIVKEEVSEWPVRIGTIYRNQNKDGVWMKYIVVDFKENEIFELMSKDKNYHVRYTHKDLDNKLSELEYYEWVDSGKLLEPFTMKILEKLKKAVEKETK